MRFKRLRMTLGVTITIFIFVVANILVLGSFGEDAKAIPKNNLSLKVGQNKVQTQFHFDSDGDDEENFQIPSVQQQIPNSTPPVTHSFKTRAS